MPAPVAPVTTTERRIALAGIFRIAAIASQPVAMIALLVLWKHFHVSFWTAIEWCLVAGIGAYTALGACASILLTLARLQPVALFISHVTRFVSVLVFAFLRYVYGLGFVRSVLTWAVIYVVAYLLTRRAEVRVRRRFSV